MGQCLFIVNFIKINKNVGLGVIDNKIKNSTWNSNRIEYSSDGNCTVGGSYLGKFGTGFK